MKNIILGILLVLCCHSAAQISTGGFPLRAQGTRLRSGAAVPEIVMPKADFEADKAADKKRKRSCGLRFAHKFVVNLDVKENGVKSEADGYNIWEVAIKSEDAYSLNLIFDNLDLPEGARLFLFTPNKEQMLGAYTSANNTPNLFATSPLDGDKIIVHYEEPQSTVQPAKLVINNVNHDYRGLRMLPDYAYSDPCEIDAKHDTLHTDSRRSACLLIIDGMGVCSGNLINNTANDANPYIMSAGHCFYPNYWTETIDTVKAQSTIVFFNYESPNRAWKIRGTREQSLSGGHTIAYNKLYDMLLIRMNDVPPADYRAYYAGWNREDEVKGTAYCFHHPESDVKKISTSKSVPVTKSFDDEEDEEEERFYYDSHWFIEEWESGVTESGSSGSGLFCQDGLLIGALSGGDSYCDTPGGDFYWQIGKAWSDTGTIRNSLGYWLDPKNSGVSTHLGMEPYKNPCRRITHLDMDEEPSANVGDSEGNYIAGSNNQGIDEVAEKFAVGKASSLYGVYFVPPVGGYEEYNPIYVRIYNGNEKPDSLVYEQRVKIQTSQYYRTRKSWETITSDNWSNMENYIRFATPIKVDSCFFVAFSFDNDPLLKEDFALYFSKEKAENTAYFHTERNGWQPYTQHPSFGKGTALMVDAVINDGWEAPEQLNPAYPSKAKAEPAATGKATLYPSVSSGTLTLSMPQNEKLESIQVTDMQGRILYQKDGLNVSDSYTLSIDGVCRQEDAYLLNAEFKSSARQTFKFIRTKK